MAEMLENVACEFGHDLKALEQALSSALSERSGQCESGKCQNRFEHVDH